MRKIRFYVMLKPKDGAFEKYIADGYLDDNCEIGYYHKGIFDPFWMAIVLDCGSSIAEELKLKDVVIEANENWKYVNTPGAQLKHSHKEAIEIFKNINVGNDREFCLNCWKETDKFIDLTTIEGQKILKTIKSKKT